MIENKKFRKMFFLSFEEMLDAIEYILATQSKNLNQTDISRIDQYRILRTIQNTAATSKSSLV